MKGKKIERTEERKAPDIRQSDMERLRRILNADFSNRSGCFVLTYDTADGEDVGQ